MQRLEQSVEILIEDLTEDGKGVAKADGFVIFVEGATLGDTCEAEITKVKKNLAFAKAKKILKKSDKRKPAGEQCPHLTDCGGCPYGLLKYQDQLDLKQKQVQDKLTRIGKLNNPKVANIIGMPKHRGYRNKAVFHAKCHRLSFPGVDTDETLSEKPLKVEMGFYSPKTHSIVDVKGCQIIPEEMDELLEFAKDNIKSDCTVTIKASKTTGDAMVVFQYPKEMVIAGGDTILDEMNIAGQEMKFEISPTAFYQVNPVQTVKLYEKVLEYLDLKGDEKILDIYCGVGTIGLVCAKVMAAKNGSGKVLGIESVKEAVLDANRNATINYIVNAEYIQGKAEEKLEEIKEFNGDVAILDPPRAGCDQKLLETIAKAGIPKICYVSCNPATLARDIRFLEDNSYRFVEATPVDMFPETGHVECVTLLEKK